MNKSHYIKVRDESDLYNVASYITPLFGKGLHILLYGDLGAGKTTFTKYFLRETGVKDDISSPTYSIVNEYEVNDQNIAHIDLYRLEDTEEALDMGIEDFLDHHLCIIEWPQIIENLIDDHIKIEITVEGDERIFEVTHISRP